MGGGFGPLTHPPRIGCAPRAVVVGVLSREPSPPRIGCAPRTVVGVAKMLPILSPLRIGCVPPMVVGLAKMLSPPSPLKIEVYTLCKCVHTCPLPPPLQSIVDHSAITML